MAKTLKWLLGVLVTLIILLLLAVAAILVFFHSDAGKDFVADRASQALGRQVSIRGDLDLDLSLTPVVTLHDLTVANAAWSDSPSMAEIRTVTLQFDLRKLIVGNAQVQAMTIDHPELVFERSEHGERNWGFLFGEPRGTSRRDSGQAGPAIREISLKDGSFRYRNPVFAREPLKGTVKNLHGEFDRSRGAVGLRGTGDFQDQAYAVDLVGDAAKDADTIPVQGKITLGNASARVDGSIKAPFSLRNASADLTLEVPEPHSVVALFGPELEPWPALTLEARLTFGNEQWRLGGMDARLGDSEISGDLAYSYANPRPDITATLKATHVDLEQFSSALSDTRAATRKLSELPLREIRFPAELLGKADVELQLDAESLQVLSARLQGVKVDASLADSHLQGRHLEFQIDGGTLVADFDIRAEKIPVRISLNIDADSLDLRKVLAGFDIDKEGFGAINARAKLSASGKRVQDFLATAEGDVAAIMEDGRLDRLMVQLAGQDIMASLEALIGSEQATAKLRCFIADWTVGKGLAEVQRLVIDTENNKVVGDGQVNLVNGKVDLELLPRAKDFSLLSAQAPMHIRGSIRNPEISVDEAEVVSSLLTPVELGVGEDADCRQLAEAARKSL